MVILDAVLVVIILDGGLYSLFGEHGAVQLVRRESVKLIDDLLVCDGKRLVNSLALYKLGSHGGRSYCARAAESLELDIVDFSVFYLEIHLHYITALRVADLADTVRIGDLADIARIHEMIHNLIAV